MATLWIKTNQKSSFRSGSCPMFRALFPFVIVVYRQQAETNRFVAHKFEKKWHIPPFTGMFQNYKIPVGSLYHMKSVCYLYFKNTHIFRIFKAINKHILINTNVTPECEYYMALYLWPIKNYKIYVHVSFFQKQLKVVYVRDDLGSWIDLKFIWIRSRP